jgi:hypothetical protein
MKKNRICEWNILSFYLFLGYQDSSYFELKYHFIHTLFPFCFWGFLEGVESFWKNFLCKVNFFPPNFRFPKYKEKFGGEKIYFAKE